MYQNLDLKRPNPDLVEPIENYYSTNSDDDNVFCYSQYCQNWVFGEVAYDVSNNEFYCHHSDGKFRKVTHFMRAPLLMLI